MPYGEFVRGLDRTNPRHLALIHEATALFRGAGYTAFDGEPPEQREHAAVAAPYAHVTAPLRRLVDRFGLVVCEAACRGADVPDAVRAALPRPRRRSCASPTGGPGPPSGPAPTPPRRRCCTAARGSSFGAVVVDHTDKGMEVQLVDLPVLARVTGDRCPAGARVRPGSTWPTCAPVTVGRSCDDLTAVPTRDRRGTAGPTLAADESGGRSRRWATTAEEGPGSEGQDGGQQPPGVTRGTVPQRTDRPLTGRASGGSKGETVV